VALRAKHWLTCAGVALIAAPMAASVGFAATTGQAPDRNMPPSVGVLPPLKLDLACLQGGGLSEFRNGDDGDYEVLTIGGCGLEPRVVRRHKTNPRDHVSMPCHLAHLLKAKCRLPLSESKRQ
jgi:hypothetical protein